MVSPMNKEHIERFRGIVWSGYPSIIKDKKSLSLLARVSGDRSIVHTCEVTQGGETVTFSNDPDPCSKALDEFEELVKEAKYDVRPGLRGRRR